LKLLILGGTIFLGRHLVEAALAAGHEVTLFNRGRHNPALFPETERLMGNRDGNLTALKGRFWHAVIDTSGHLPSQVRASAEMLSESVEHYTFISTISVYGNISQIGIDEGSAVMTAPEAGQEEITAGSYGPLKVACERIADQAMPGRALIIRPGLIVGPYDPTDRFTYWPFRVAKGRTVLAPGRPERPVQFVDVRDLARWTLDMVQRRASGTYNATGPDRKLTMRQLLSECKAVSESDAVFHWVDDNTLLELHVTPWSELPLWIPEEEEMRGFLSVNCKKAIGDGLVFRPLASTIRDTLEWSASRGRGVRWEAGLSPRRERELLQKLHARTT